jgi:hypothetical protein
MCDATYIAPDSLQIRVSIDVCIELMRSCYDYIAMRA